MKKMKYLCGLLCLPFVEAGLMYASGCSANNLTVTCDTNEANWNNGEAVFTFTLSKTVAQNEFEISTDSDMLSIKSCNVDAQKLTVYIQAKTNTTKTLSFNLTIKCSKDNFKKDYHLFINNFPVPTYQLTFTASTGGKIIGTTSHVLDAGTLIGKYLPEKQADDGYAFDGWYVDGTEINPSTYTLAKNITVEARFVQCEAESNFTISGSSITGYTGSSTKLYIPKKINSTTITTIGTAAFRSNNTINKVVLPEECTTIKTLAFAVCNNLKTICLNAKLNTIEATAFDGTGLNSVKTNKVGDIWTQYDSENKIVDQITESADLANAFKSLSQGSLKYINFTNDSWATVISYAKIGISKLHEVYGTSNMVGMERIIHLSGTVYRTRVVGESHDELVGGLGKAALTFEMVNVVDTSKTLYTPKDKMDDLKYDGYLGSYLYKEHMTPDGTYSNLLKMYEPDLFAGLQLIKKKTLTVNKTTSAYQTTEYNAKVFINSYSEIFGDTYKGQTTGNQYEYWKSNKTDIARIKTDTSGNKCSYFISDAGESTSMFSHVIDTSQIITDGGYVSAPTWCFDENYISFSFCI